MGMHHLKDAKWDHKEAVPVMVTTELLEGLLRWLKAQREMTELLEELYYEALS